MRKTLDSPSSREMVVKMNPAVRQTGWLPRGLWPGLDALAERHDEAVARVAYAIHELHEARESFEAEDEASVRAYATGEDVPEVTDRRERERAMDEGRAKVKGAQENLQTVVAEAIETVQAQEESGSTTSAAAREKPRRSAPRRDDCLRRRRAGRSD
jgi:hypothetical protein